MKGLDVGTGNLIAMDKDGIRIQRNAFMTIDKSVASVAQLKKMDVPYVILNNKIYIVGTKSAELANIFNSDLRRCMAQGTLNPQEQDALPIIKILIENLLGTPTNSEELVVYCIPGNPIDRYWELAYHEGMVKSIIESCGYKARSINEAVALGNYGLQNDEYTGIAISAGAGNMNIAIMYNGMAALTFAISRSGDFIDESVAQACGIGKAKAAYIKEKSDYSISPFSNVVRSKEQNAIKTYYEVLIQYLLSNIDKQFSSAQKMPAFPKPVPIILGGGTSQVEGFVDLFKEQFNQKQFPIEISDIRLIDEPLVGVVRGCYMDAELGD